MPYLTEDDIPAAAQKIAAAAGVDEPEFQTIMEIFSKMLKAAGDDATGRGARGMTKMTAQHVCFTIAAAGLLAGYLTGGSIAAGAMDDTDDVKDGIREVVSVNFQQGLQMGMDAVALELVERKETQQ